MMSRVFFGFSNIWLLAFLGSGGYYIYCWLKYSSWPKITLMGNVLSIDHIIWLGGEGLLNKIAYWFLWLDAPLVCLMLMGGCLFFGFALSILEDDYH